MGKLLEYDRDMTKNLRKTILDDVGNPRLKKDMLDLIQKLESGHIVKHHLSHQNDDHNMYGDIKTAEGGV